MSHEDDDDDGSSASSGTIDGMSPSEFVRERNRRERVREARERRARDDSPDEPSRSERESALADSNVDRGSGGGSSRSSSNGGGGSASEGRSEGGGTGGPFPGGFDPGGADTGSPDPAPPPSDPEPTPTPDPTPEPPEPEPSQQERRIDAIAGEVRRDPDVARFDPTRDVERIAPGAFVATFGTDEGTTETQRFAFDETAVEEFRQRTQERFTADVAEQTGLQAGEGFRIEPTDGGFEAELTPQGRQTLQSEAREAAISDLETQLEARVGRDLERGQDFEVIREGFTFRARAVDGGTGETTGTPPTPGPEPLPDPERLDALADVGGPGTPRADVTITPDTGETPALDRLVEAAEEATGLDVPGEGSVTRDRFPGEGEQRIFGPDFPIDLPSDFEPGSTDVGLRGTFEGAGPIPSGGTERFETIFGDTLETVNREARDPAAGIVGELDADIYGPLAAELNRRPAVASAVKQTGTGILGPVAGAGLTGIVDRIQVEDTPEEARQLAESEVSEAGAGAAESAFFVATLPVSAPLTAKEAVEFNIGAGEAVREDRVDEFLAATETEALDVAARSAEVGLQNPTRTAGFLGGSLLFSGGAIAGAQRLGGPVAGRAVSITVQPFEEAAIAGARSGLISRSTATKVPGVREGMLGPAERGQLDLVPDGGKLLRSGETETTLEDNLRSFERAELIRSAEAAAERRSVEEGIEAGLRQERQTDVFTAEPLSGGDVPGLDRPIHRIGTEARLGRQRARMGPRGPQQATFRAARRAEQAQRPGVEQADTLPSGESEFLDRLADGIRLTEPSLGAFDEPLIGTEPAGRQTGGILSRLDRSTETILGTGAAAGGATLLGMETATRPRLELGQEFDLGLDIGTEPATRTRQELGQEVGLEFGQELGQELGQEVGTELGQEQRREVGRELGQEFGFETGREFGREIGLELGLEVGFEFGLEAALPDPDDRFAPVSDGFFSGFAERQFVSPIGELGILGDLKLSPPVTEGFGFVGPVTGAGPLFESGGFGFGTDRKRKKKKKRQSDDPLAGWNFDIV